jgi:hypothetical protein
MIVVSSEVETPLDFLEPAGKSRKSEIPPLRSE